MRKTFLIFSHIFRWNKGSSSNEMSKREKVVHSKIKIKAHENHTQTSTAIDNPHTTCTTLTAAEIGASKAEHQFVRFRTQKQQEKSHTAWQSSKSVVVLCHSSRQRESDQQSKPSIIYDRLWIMIQSKLFETEKQRERKKKRERETEMFVRESVEHLQ